MHLALELEKLPELGMKNFCKITTISFVSMLISVSGLINMSTKQ